MPLYDRLKNLWEKSATSSEVDTLTLLRVLYPEEEAQRRFADIRARSSEGDGGATVMSEGTESEYEDYVHEEVHGWKSFMDTVRSLPTNIVWRTPSKD